jgi:hypothetical protein
MLEAAAKFAVYLMLGAALLACNIWYVRAVYQSIKGGDLVVAPVKVVGGTGDAAIAGESLAGMIISSLGRLEWDLQQSQSTLRQDEPAAKEGPRKAGREDSTQPNARESAATKARASETPPAAARSGVTAGILGIPKTAFLNAQLFEPTKIDVKVAGVDVGGLLPRIQRWFVSDRTLTFSVAWDGKKAVVEGNLDALGVGKAKPIWISIENATPHEVADAIALALIHRRWGKDSAEFGELEDGEFKTLVSAINETARVNRRVINRNVVAKADFERILGTVNPLADRVSGWGELTHFVASIAEGAENYERALALYRRLRNAPKSPLSAEILAAKISSLEGLTTTTTGDTKQAALEKMRKYSSDAARILNGLFGLALPDPELELISDDTPNAYWDGKRIKAPSVVQSMPDIVYHEAAWPFLQNKFKFRYEGESGALAQSYTDVLASLVKQTILKQTAQDADWVIAPGAIAWVTGKPDEIATDRRPLRSLKAPGTAYDDPVIGKDPQPDHYKNLVKLPRSNDGGGIHINSGIPNRAFYEAAVRIGSEKAGKIWISSIGQFSETVDLKTASQLIQKTAVALHGEGSAEARAVKAAWNAVGL